MKPCQSLKDKKRFPTQCLSTMRCRETQGQLSNVMGFDLPEANSGNLKFSHPHRMLFRTNHGIGRGNGTADMDSRRSRCECQTRHIAVGQHYHFLQGDKCGMLLLITCNLSCQARSESFAPCAYSSSRDALGILVREAALLAVEVRYEYNMTFRLTRPLLF